MSTQNKVAIVTGGSRGIGAAISERLAREGFKVVINYSSDDAAAEALVRRIEGAGGRAVAAKGDVSDPAAVRRLFDTTEAAFGGVDVLVNSAGIMPMGKIADVDDATFDRVMAINVKGTFNTLREAARRMRDGGRIVSMSSNTGAARFENYGVYSASKVAIDTLTATLSREMRGRSITANTVAPGPTESDLFFKGKTQEQIDRLTHIAPLERLGKPEDVANVVSFLVGPEGGWINGQVVRSNGGML
jgi:3-oxoacyl-[acyl-carrier protein] reductase